MNLNDADHERELIRRTLEGESWAFDRLMQAHEKPLYRVALAMLGDHDRAADVVQETFVRAYRSLAGFKGESRLGTWLHRIAVNLCLSQLRKDRLRRAFSLSETAQRLLSRAPDPERELAGKDLAARIAGAVASLPPRQRAVFVMRQIEEMPHGQIARILGLSEGAVRASFFQALRKLRERLGEHDDEHE